MLLGGQAKVGNRTFQMDSEHRLCVHGYKYPNVPMEYVVDRQPILLVIATQLELAYLYTLAGDMTEQEIDMLEKSLTWHRGVLIQQKKEELYQEIVAAKPDVRDVYRRIEWRDKLPHYLKVWGHGE